MSNTPGQTNIGCGCLLLSIFITAFVATAGVVLALRILGF